MFGLPVGYQWATGELTAALGMHNSNRQAAIRPVSPNAHAATSTKVFAVLGALPIITSNQYIPYY